MRLTRTTCSAGEHSSSSLIVEALQRTIGTTVFCVRALGELHSMLTEIALGKMIIYSVLYTELSCMCCMSLKMNVFMVWTLVLGLVQV